MPRRGCSCRKLVSTGIPQFMAARALAVTGGSFRDALTFVHDNVDQPPEFWQAEAERQAKLEAERLVREAKEREEAEWAAIEKKYDEDYAAWVAGGKKKGLEPVKPERKVAAPES